MKQEHRAYLKGVKERANKCPMTKEAVGEWISKAREDIFYMLIILDEQEKELKTTTLRTSVEGEK